MALFEAIRGKMEALKVVNVRPTCCVGVEVNKLHGLSKLVGV
mgnify:CR=1 FL=1